MKSSFKLKLLTYKIISEKLCNLSSMLFDKSGVEVERQIFL